MSETILSYCLFEPITMHLHRTWDKNRMEMNRYWYNIPALLIANEILYPNFDTRFYISPSVKNNPLFPILKDTGVQVEEVELEFERTSEPMLWRMMPLWDDVSCFFTRDVDSIPNREEAQCTLYFKNSDHHIQTIRSHENHYHEQGCDMLGGLSGFKPKLIKKKPQNFTSYYKSKNDMPWAQDQYLMVNTFIYSQEDKYINKRFLDCPINNQSRSAKFSCSEINEKQKNTISFSQKQEEVLEIIERNNISTWAGEPCDTRGNILKQFLSLDTKMGRKINKLFKSDDSIANFYGVCNEDLSKQVVA